VRGVSFEVEGGEVFGFLGPLRLKERLGTLEPRAVADADLEPLFREKPAIHRFPGSMATRVRELAAAVT